MVFKHHISFATNLAANYDCNRFKITPYIVSKLLRRHLKSLRCSIKIWADALSSDRSSIQTCCFAQDSIRNMLFCSYVIFLLRDQWMIARLSEAMGAALVGNNFSPIPSKFSFHMKKKSDSSRPEIYKALKPYWLLNWFSIARVVACFPQASRSRPSATAADSKRPVFVLARPTRASRAWERPQELGCWFCPSTPLITFWNSLWRDCQMTGKGSNLDSNLNSAAWSTSCNGFIASKITE